MKEIKKIKKLMIDALEKPDGKGILRGDYVCHEDIPEKSLLTLDGHFTVCGEKESPVYLVLIQKIKL